MRLFQRATKPEKYPLIPGLQVKDITRFMERFLFTCSKPHEFKKRWTTTCTNSEHTKFVVINGPDARRVDFVSWSILQKANPTDAYASEFLALASQLFLLPVSYQVQEWVERTLPLAGDGSNRQSTLIGKVKFTLYGDVATRSLDMEGIQ